ncbi:hypothetical protein [Paenibacillus albidus]|uniref:hypothetical protein n=1 Tax=Paenibacillus albidus TaxID=2041023 RepID=UPI00166CC479|nr:hypothetical protein [Paenibacillus albidus]
MYIRNIENIEIQACSAFPDAPNAAKSIKGRVCLRSDAQNAVKPKTYLSTSSLPGNQRAINQQSTNINQQPTSNHPACCTRLLFGSHGYPQQTAV